MYHELQRYYPPRKELSPNQKLAIAAGIYTLAYSKGNKKQKKLLKYAGITVVGITGLTVLGLYTGDNPVLRSIKSLLTPRSNSQPKIVKQREISRPITGGLKITREDIQNVTRQN